MIGARRVCGTKVSKVGGLEKIGGGRFDKSSEKSAEFGKNRQNSIEFSPEGKRNSERRLIRYSADFLDAENRAINVEYRPILPINRPNYELAKTGDFKRKVGVFGRIIDEFFAVHPTIKIQGLLQHNYRKKISDIAPTSVINTQHNSRAITIHEVRTYCSHHE